MDLPPAIKKQRLSAENLFDLEPISIFHDFEEQPMSSKWSYFELNPSKIDEMLENDQLEKTMKAFFYEKAMHENSHLKKSQIIHFERIKFLEDQLKQMRYQMNNFSRIFQESFDEKVRSYEEELSHLRSEAFQKDAKIEELQNLVKSLNDSMEMLVQEKIEMFANNLKLVENQVHFEQQKSLLSREKVELSEKSHCLMRENSSLAQEIVHLKETNRILQAETKDLNKEMEKWKDMDLCVICMDAKREILFFPCNHLICCKKCSKSILKKEETCSLCRNKITGSLKIFK